MHLYAWITILQCQKAARKYQRLHPPQFQWAHFYGQAFPVQTPLQDLRQIIIHYLE